jgi:hypothetical protein
LSFITVVDTAPLWITVSQAVAAIPDDDLLARVRSVGPRQTPQNGVLGCMRAAPDALCGVRTALS